MLVYPKKLWWIGESSLVLEVLVSVAFELAIECFFIFVGGVLKGGNCPSPFYSAYIVNLIEVIYITVSTKKDA